MATLNLGGWQGGAYTDGPRRRKQSESRHSPEEKGLRFPGGGGVMPPVVWGL